MNKNAENNYQEKYDDLSYTLDNIEHNETTRNYKNTTNTTKKEQKNADNYSCILCDFHCSKQSNYNKHLSTTKHKNTTKYNQNKATQEFICKCGKSYPYRSSLHNHKKSCMINIESNNKTLEQYIDTINDKNNITSKDDNKKDKIIDFFMNEYSDFKNLIIDVVKNNSELFKQNQDFQVKMFETIKATTNITNNNMNNCNNQTFNLQFFLNETCKDAMNMSDFINSFNLQMNDLERLADDGYVKTMSSLIVDKVRELDVEKRPIHCSDEKREIIYIKEDDVWIKDDENKNNLRKAINKVGAKNIGILQDWQQAHPNCIKSNSPYNDTYLKMMREVMGGKDTTGNENKVMKNIIKEVVIDKKQYITN